MLSTVSLVFTAVDMHEVDGSLQQQQQQGSVLQYGGLYILRMFFCLFFIFIFSLVDLGANQSQELNGLHVHSQDFQRVGAPRGGSRIFD